MKKTMGSLLALALAVLGAQTSFAQETKPFQDIPGFADGSRTNQIEIRQNGGAVRVPFLLGADTENLRVELDVNRGGRYLEASYEDGAVVLLPRMEKRADRAEFEVEIDVVDRVTKELVEGDFFLTGFIHYDWTQAAEDGGAYNSADGVFYDFGRGAEDVRVQAAEDVLLEIAKSPAGEMELSVARERSAALDTMFAKHRIEYVQFITEPEFPADVRVTVRTPARYIYEYADGILRRVETERVPDGLRFSARRLTGYLLTNDTLTEGIVDEERLRIYPL